MTPILIVPGYGGSGPDHWQSWLEARLAGARRVALPALDRPRCADWVDALERAVAACDEPPLLVAHSLGCIAVAHWARARPGHARGALLVAPCDAERSGGLEGVEGFAPIPLQKLDFPALVVASTNDPFVPFERAQDFAHAWGARLVAVPGGGHLNVASGFGAWPEAEALLRELLVETDVDARLRSSGASARRESGQVGISVEGISKRFGAFEALRDVSLEVASGELVALLGPSGSGKTTLLRILAGLAFADAGVVRFEGEDATERSARDRRVGFVFQHYALFRHMSVFENVAFGLRVRPRSSRPSEESVQARVHELLSLVQLEGLSQRLPSELSGGQRQRVALARALAVEPRVLLLDEPFGALDARVRKELRRWLRRLHDDLGLTSVFVTHDQDEALELADRVVLMSQGRIEQIGTPDEVYHAPATPFVYEFLGDVNVFRARGEEQGGRVYVRPHLLEIEREVGTDPAWRVRVERIHAAGPTVKVELRTREGAPVHAELSQERHRVLGLAPGEEVYVRPREARVFRDDYAI